MSNPRFSIASYSFHSLFSNGAMNLIQYFESVRYRYGLDTADIWNSMIASFDDEYLAMVKAQMDERGLKLVNLCSDLAHVWADDEKEARITTRTAQDSLKAARILGAETVRIDMGVAEWDASDEQIEACARKYDEYCAIADEFGAKLGPENHWGGSINIKVIRKLFQAVKAKNFGLLLHLDRWKLDTPEEKQACNVEMAPKAMHMHVNHDACANAEVAFPPLLGAGYVGAWGIESGKGTNEYNEAAYLLIQTRKAIAPLNYQANWNFMKDEKNTDRMDGMMILRNKVMGATQSK